MDKLLDGNGKEINDEGMRMSISIGNREFVLLRKEQKEKAEKFVY